MESTNSYQLKQEEDNYILSITMLEESIKLSCDNTAGQIYSKIFSLEELKAKDQIFANIQNAFDVIEIFDDILKNEKVRVVEEESGVMQILLFIASEDRNIELTLEKELGEINQEQIGQNLEENKDNYYQDLNANVENEYNVNEVNVNVNTNNEYIENFENREQNIASNYEEYNTTNVESTINTGENIATNVNMEHFNMEEFLKGTQPEVNTNMESNAQLEMNINNMEMNNNIEENTNSNYVQNENINVDNTQQKNADFNMNNQIYYSFGQPSENTNINTNINTTTEFNNNNFNINTQTTTSQTQTQTTQTQTSQTQTSQTQTDIFTQPRQEKQNEYSLPFITPADAQPAQNTTTTTSNAEYGEYSSSMSKISTENVIIPTTTQTTTSTTQTKYHEVSLSLPKDKKNEEEEQRISKLQGEQSTLKSQHSVFNTKITQLTNLINSYRAKITLLQRQNNANELQALRAENARIKQQLAEIGKLRKDVAEAQYLKNQLNEYEILRQKASQVDSMKNQLAEINNLKMKIAELSGLKSRVDEIRKLKEEISGLSNYSTSTNEINNLKAQIMQMENMTQLKQNTHMTSIEKKEEKKMTKTVIKGDIIHNLDELEMLTRKINKSNNKIILNLLYKATADSDTAEAFHQKCDKAESTLVLVQADNGKRFGGFTSRNWRGDCEEKKDSDAFVFSLDKMKIYDIVEGEDAIGCYPQCGPVFLGCQIRIFDNAFKKGGTTFERGANYETEEDFELTGGNRAFGIKEIEVYEVIVE